MNDAMRRLAPVLALLLALLAPGGLARAQSGAGDIVREIHVEGTQRIEAETVRSYLTFQRGESYDPARVDSSIKALFATGLFADVTIRRQGANVIVAVVENPVVNRIAFENNKKLSDETLTAETTLRPRNIYTRTKIQNDVQRILTLYRRNGRFAATVEPKVIRLPQNRVDVVFEIDEGAPTAVQRIRFVGNKEFGDGKLRDVIRTKETRWYRFLSSDDTYDPDRLTLDRELLRQYYLSKGFADFRVLSAVAELTPDRNDFFITFTIDEGARYRFGKIEIESVVRGVTPADVADAIEVEEGDWYSGKELENAVDNLILRVSGMGHPFVDVRPRIDRDREKRVINVAFEVGEGPRMFVERIEIVGNVRTQDRVIRRQFRLAEGDAFNAAKLKRSRERIKNLDYFEKLSVEQLPGSAPDKTILKTEVEEKSTGSISLGVGYSTANGALTDVTLRERNFLGRGQDVRIGGRVAQRGTQIDFGFTEPAFLDRELSAGFDAFHVTRDLVDISGYKFKSTGGGVRFGYLITERLSQGWRYTLRSAELQNFRTGISPLILAEDPTFISSEVGHTLGYDRLDSTVSPTSGYFVRMNNDVAGLGGDVFHVRNKLSGGKYFPLQDDWVLGLRATGGYIAAYNGKNVRISDRFMVGGDDIRGFRTGGIGPRDSTGDTLGGEWMYAGTAEVLFPLGLPPEFGVKGKMFTDLGSAGKIDPTSATVRDTGSLRASVGAGINWASPFGPIGIDFGVPVLKESFDKTELVRVNFGTKF
jgi:outer membrane protein insertion porin family